MITIYHNPHCSKSREALSIAEQFATRQGMPLAVVEYLKTPLDAGGLVQLQSQLGVQLRDMVRANEEQYAALLLAQADDAALLDALVAHPVLMQRPIIACGERAVIARPPELLHEFFQALQ
jgi:arsenate reductase (glutaredoxin)